MIHLIEFTGFEYTLGKDFLCHFLLVCFFLLNSSDFIYFRGGGPMQLLVALLVHLITVQTRAESIYRYVPIFS
jgi:hypothetical protein